MLPLVATPYTQNKVREFKRERERDRIKLFEKKREKGKKRDKNCTVAKLPSRTVSLCLNCSKLELVKMREKETNNKCQNVRLRTKVSVSRIH